MSSGRLNGKFALITGGGGGFGQAIGTEFARQGARVALTDVNMGAAEAARDAIEAMCPGQAFAFAHDVTDKEAWARVLKEADAAMGGINVLINNAGICVPATVEDADDDDWDRSMRINCDSIYYGTKLALPYLRASQPASIINISSISGIVAGHNMAAYNTSKAGAWMLTKSTALHVARKGDDIRANSIHPAFIETAMVEEIFSPDGERRPLSETARVKLARQIPLGRLGAAEDVAHAAVYLASDESRFMTGAELKLDGGLSAA